MMKHYRVGEKKVKNKKVEKPSPYEIAAMNSQPLVSYFYDPPFGPRRPVPNYYDHQLQLTSPRKERELLGCSYFTNQYDHP